MPQNTNLNVSPYFDDFDSNKGYQKVLFRPGSSIQARELTTLQSILQDQIEKFGKHFFKEGSLVIPGQIAYDSDYTCVKIDSFHFGIPVSAYIDKLVGKTIRGETSGVTAVVENYLTSENSEESLYTLYVKYQTSSNVNFSTNTFIDGENLITLENIDYALSSIRANNSFATSIVSGSISTGSAAKIEEGVYFVRGYFVTVPKQTVILDQYGNSPSYRVGLLVNEELAVASDDYPDLYDNARGFSNFAAPGADRLKISLTLIKKSLNDFNDENFIELLRIINGDLQKFVKTSDYQYIKDEFARRTKDESGDYYIKPFNIAVKESLNNYIGNNGIYNSNQLTTQGNIPSDDLSCVTVSPGKAYVGGYEVETINTTIIDLEKPRTTERKTNEFVPFNIGRKIEINNVFNSLPVGFGTTSHIKLYDKRTSTSGISSGTQIGVARVYDYKIKNTEYQNKASKYEISIYDAQTYTILTLNASINTLSTSTYVQGKNSGASGFLVNSITSSNSLTLYQVSGSFYIGEEIILNGINSGKVITSLNDYNLSDVHQITAPSVSGIGSFSADIVLNNLILLSNNASITSAGVVKSSSINFASGIKVGDIISYTKSGNSVPTYNRVTSISSDLSSFNVEETPTITNVCDGSLPGSTITVSDLSKAISNISKTNESFLYSHLNNDNVSNLILDDSSYVFRKTYKITISGSGYSTPLPESDQNLILSDFDEENYNLSYISNGAIESLNSEKISVSEKTVTLSNLSVSSGDALLTVTWRKLNPKVRGKIYNRSSTITISNSSLSASGIGSTTLNDGLTYSSLYGTRVQDKEISLNVPDVESVIDIIESSTSSSPTLPYLIFINLNSTISNTIKGEKLVGETSKAIAQLVSVDAGTNRANFVYLNDNRFIFDEKVNFEESGIFGTVNAYNSGDRSIKDVFLLDDGQRSEYLDFSRLVRKKDKSAPTKKITVVYNNYTISSLDDGDFVSINSYGRDRYSSNIPSVDGVSLSDIIDLRPRVSSYSGSYSPFEYRSRVFTSNQNSSERIFAQDNSIIVSYDYYLPRIDKIFVTKDGNFVVNKGVPSLSPKTPNDLDLGMEIATLYIPAYLYDTNDVKIQFTNHKRYTMKDISRLEDRISNIEYYTSLSLLESDTQNLTIRDSSTNLNRFKCGFFVDNFKSLNGDTFSEDYKASIDISNGTLRPEHYSTSIDLVIGSESLVGINQEENTSVDIRYTNDLGSSDVKRVGDVVLLNYNEVVYAQNSFATRAENINPFNTTKWIGSIEMNPSSDTWVYENNPTKFIEGSNTSPQQKNNGFSPREWNSWETNWAGVNDSATGPSVSNLQTGSTSTIHTRKGLKNKSSSVGIDKFLTTSSKDSLVNFQNDNVVLSSSQNRQGIQFGVSDRSNTYTTGNSLVSRSSNTIMRSRNIEVVARRLKPNTLLNAFFDNVSVSQYIVPKLLEVTMQSGTFANGETVVGKNENQTIVFRLANQNHKFGPYNNPSETFTSNPYDPSNNLSSSYSSTTTILNVDTASLESQSVTQFFGSVSKGMKLVGKTSNAVALVSNIRIITDANGDFIGSFFIPDPKVPSNPTFDTGVKTFVLTSSSTNSTITSSNDSYAEVNFTSGGVLTNLEESTLSLRNTYFESKISERSKWTDPLAQTFEVQDPNGVFVTRCQVYFQSKDNNNIPVTLQIRSVDTNVPSDKILPFSEKVLTPNQVVVSDNASLPTTFIFDSPVYLESGKTYAIVLSSPSSSYKVWISRISEEDVESKTSTTNANPIIVSQQPTLGELFKSQNASIWNPSPLEDLKFILYRANFTSSSGSVRFYNPSLGIGNNQIASLDNNCLTTNSKKTLVGIAKSLTYSEIQTISAGSSIGQSNNSNFSGKLISVSGSVGIGTTLTVTGVGTGFIGSSYSNVKLKTLTGYGVNAKANVLINSGIVSTVTITDGGYGYLPGDTLTFSDISEVGGYGKNVVLTIPNTVGIITSYNSLIVDNIQGTLDITNTSSNSIIGNGTTITNAYAIFSKDISDGLHFKVNHKNHGMYSQNNIVQLSGIESDVPPETLTANYSSSSSGVTAIVVSSGEKFKLFENVVVSASNPGYIVINDEIIQYTTVDSNSLTGITRGIDNTTPRSHNANDFVYKYEFNGVSLRRINTQHKFASVDSNNYPIEIDSYYIKLDTKKSGVDRSSTSSSGFPELFFMESKIGGSRSNSISNNSNGPKSTQNITFNVIRPNVQTIIPNSTFIESRIRTVSGSSVNGSEISYLDKGFENISLTSNNILPDTRIISSKINETEKLSSLPGKKSFTMEMTLKTNDSRVSPVIDLDRVNIITSMNRIDNPVSDFKLDSSVNKLGDDPNSAIYVSKIIKLEKGADNLKVIFDAYRHASNEIILMYRIFRNDSPDQNQLFELFPGYDNLDLNGNVINPANNSGKSDRFISSSNRDIDFSTYEYTAKNLPLFNGFQIKIIMTGTNQSYVPKIRDLRVIATI